MNRASVALRDALGEWALTDISAAISAIRQIKSAEEAAFLEDLAYRADHAILGAAHHSLACDARAEKGQAELIRMHALNGALRPSPTTGFPSPPPEPCQRLLGRVAQVRHRAGQEDGPRRNEPP